VCVLVVFMCGDTFCIIRRKCFYKCEDLRREVDRALGQVDARCALALPLRLRHEPAVLDAQPWVGELGHWVLLEKDGRARAGAELRVAEVAVLRALRRSA